MDEQPALKTDDIYCELILSGRLPVEVVAETDQLLAFFHTRPVAPFHVVVVPKQHVRTLLDVEDVTLFGEVFAMVAGIVRERGLDSKAFRVITNGGTYQDSKHLHFHLLAPQER